MSRPTYWMFCVLSEWIKYRIIEHGSKVLLWDSDNAMLDTSILILWSWYFDRDTSILILRSWYFDLDTSILILRSWYFDLDTSILILRSWYFDLDTSILILRSWYFDLDDLDTSILILRSWYLSCHLYHDTPTSFQTGSRPRFERRLPPADFHVWGWTDEKSVENFYPAPTSAALEACLPSKSTHTFKSGRTTYVVDLSADEWEQQKKGRSAGKGDKVTRVKSGQSRDVARSSVALYKSQFIGVNWHGWRQDESVVTQ